MKRVSPVENYCHLIEVYDGGVMIVQHSRK